MPETQTPHSDKQRKNRGLGAFLLVLSILVMVLILVGDRHLGARQDLSQDEYLWHLHKGNVASQQLKGKNEIAGELRDADGTRFLAKFESLESLETEIRELKARPAPQFISPSDLMAALDLGIYRAKSTELLTGYDMTPAGTTPSPEGPAGKQVVSQILLVEVLAAGREEAETALVQRLAEDEDFSLDLANISIQQSAGPLFLEVTKLAGGDRMETIKALEGYGATYEQKTFDLENGTVWEDPSSMFSTLLVVWGPWILIFIVFMIFMRQMRSQGGAGGVMSFGRSRAQLYSKENHTNVTFDDVAGVVEAKDEVREIVEFLKNPSRFTRIGARIPRGVLLVGPPGCGKTLLAKAIAGEAEVPFFSISGSDFVEMFVGVGASRVRDLFKQARENSPCIIFLDEIDAVGRRRGSGMGGGHDEREQTLNAILVEMDGFTTDEGIIVLAATNRPDVLDPALLRPGRFDREVTIEPADLDGRKQILNVHLKKVKSEEDLDLTVLAKSTPGYSGADLAAIVNEAAIRAALDKREMLNMEDLEESRDKVRYGRQKKSRKMEEEDRKVTAFHESGHAVVAASIDDVESPHKVTIVPRGRALGATFVLPEKESYHMQRKRMIGQLAMLFGGRVAEQEFCGDISAGASDDIKRATELARAMVTELGMSEKVGPVNYAEREGNDFLGTELMRGRSHSEETAHQIDLEVRAILDQAYQRAEGIVRGNREGIERMTDALLRYETLSRDEIESLLGGTSVEALRPASPEPGPEPQRNEKSSERRESKPAPEEGGLPGDLPGFSPA